MIATTGEAFRANKAAMDALVADLAARRQEAAAGGPPHLRQRHIERGKLMARDRVLQLLDPGSLGGLDALVFTGGIGEHAAEVRRRVCEQLGWLGIHLDQAANARHDIHIGAGNSSVDVLVIPTNEEWMIAHHTAELLGL